MRFTIAAAAVALVAGVAAHKNDTAPVYVTEVVTAYTTYCPTPTEVVHGGETYTVTEATTLTITNCPCTISHPVVPTSAPPAPPAPSAPYPTVVQPPPVVTSNIVVPPPSTPTPVAPPAFTGAAARHMVGGAGAAAAFFGMAAYVL